MIMSDYVKRSDVLAIIKRSCSDYSAAYNLIGRMEGISIDDSSRNICTDDNREEWLRVTAMLRESGHDLSRIRLEAVREDENE